MAQSSGDFEFDFACYRDNVLYATKIDDFVFFNFAKNITQELYDLKDPIMKNYRIAWEVRHIAEIKGHHEGESDGKISKSLAGSTTPPIKGISKRRTGISVNKNRMAGNIAKKNLKAMELARVVMLPSIKPFMKKTITS